MILSFGSPVEKHAKVRILVLSLRAEVLFFNWVMLAPWILQVQRHPSWIHFPPLIWAMSTVVWRLLHCDPSDDSLPHGELLSSKGLSADQFFKPLVNGLAFERALSNGSSEKLVIKTGIFVSFMCIQVICRGWCFFTYCKKGWSIFNDFLQILSDYRSSTEFSWFLYIWTRFIGAATRAKQARGVSLVPSCSLALKVWRHYDRLHCLGASSCTESVFVHVVLFLLSQGDPLKQHILMRRASLDILRSSLPRCRFRDSIQDHGPLIDHL